MSLNEHQINILKAIHQGISSQKEIANALQIRKDLVGYYLKDFEKNEFIKGAEGFPIEDVGELEYIDCCLTAKGKVAAENPSNLIKESAVTEHRTINTDKYYEQSGNIGIGHNEEEIKDNAKVAGVIYEAQQQNLADAAAKIQQLLTQLQSQGFSSEEAQKQAANDLANQAKDNPTALGKLVKWGQSLGDTAAKTIVSEAVKEVLKLALRLSGIPLP
jgi:uncharacterized protein YoaH (UPF0181 family)